MEQLTTSWTIRAETAHAEMHFVVAGFFSLEKAQSFIKELAIKTMPFIEQKVPFRVLGDMTDYVPQNREVSAAIRDQLVQARTVGLQRVAITGAPALVKLQYARLAEGIEVEFFESKVDAIGWLRSG